MAEGMGELRELLERVQAASGPDRELDRDLGFTLDGWKLDVVPAGDCIVTSTGDVYADHPGGMYPAFTESLDEALELCEKVLPGWSVLLAFNNKRAICDLSTAPIGVMGYWPGHGEAPTAPLALLAALLKALAAIQPPTKGMEG